MAVRILVTGAAGFVGCHLAEALARDSMVELVLADNLQRGRADEAFRDLCAKPNVRFVQADLKDANALANLDGDFDQVFHLAAMVGVKHCIARPAEVLETNIRSTLNVLDFVCERRAGKLLFSSTSEVYAGANDLGALKIPTAEDAPVVIADLSQPRATYAGSKIVGEQLVRFRCQAAGVPFAIVRLHNIYGPRMGFAHVIPEVIKRVWGKENPMKVFGEDETRAFCYVDDAVTALRLVMERVTGEVVHIGSMEETRVGELYRILLSQLDYHPALAGAPSPAGSVKRRCPDISRLRKLTGFEPSVPLREGLARTVEWYWHELEKRGASE